MRARRLVAPLLVLACVLVQFAPVLGGRVYRFEDIAGYFEPLWTAAARAMRDGRWPVWAPGAWSGQPLTGDPQLGAFYPPNWIWLLLPVLRAYAVMAMAHAAWGGLGMYALSRARGRTRPASALAGVALAVGGFVVLQTRHIMFVEATAWLPWVALAALKYVQSRKVGWLGATALATGMLLLTGGVSMIYYGLWFLGALIGAAAFARGDGAARPWRVRGIIVVGLALAGVAGVMLAMPVLGPMWSHGALSPRAHGTEYHFAASIAWRGLHYLPSLFLPNVLGQDVRGDYVGGGTQWEIAGYYTGVVTFALAMHALLGGARRRRAERIALGAICVLAILLAPGPNLPVHRIAYRVIPLLGSMRCPPRALYVFSLAMPLLAADGLDRLCARLRRRRRRAMARYGAWAAALVVAIDLLIAHRAENPSTTLAAARAEAFPPAVRFLAAKRGDRYVNDVHASHHLHNSGLLWGLDNASGYSSLPMWRYLHYLWITNHGAVYPHALLHDDLSAQGIWRYDSRLADALSVRWVLTARPPKAAPHYVRRFVAPPGPPGSEALDVYQNTRALPRAWVVHAAVVVDGEAAAARAIAAAGFDPRRTVILESAPAPAPTAMLAGSSEPGWISGFESAAPDAMAYEVALDEPGVLVMAEAWHPGWSARIGGAPAPLHAANLALRAVALPAGRHRIELTYTDHALARGFALSAAALAIIAVLVAIAWWRERRRR